MGISSAYHQHHEPIITISSVYHDTVISTDHHILIILIIIFKPSYRHTYHTQVWLVLTPLAKLTKPHITSRGQAIHTFRTYFLFCRVIFLFQDLCFLRMMMRVTVMMMMMMARIFAGNAIVMQSHKNSCHLLTNAFSKQAPQDPSPNWFQRGQ